MHKLFSKILHTVRIPMEVNQYMYVVVVNIFIINICIPSGLFSVDGRLWCRLLGVRTTVGACLFMESDNTCRSVRPLKICLILSATVYIIYLKFLSLLS